MILKVLLWQKEHIVMISEVRSKVKYHDPTTSQKSSKREESVEKNKVERGSISEGGRRRRQFQIMGSTVAKRESLLKAIFI